MRPPAPFDLPPVLILSTGHCGSTMVSEMLVRHPAVLSLSEFFMTLGPMAFAPRRADGPFLWNLMSRQSAALHAMLRDGIVVDENLYPLGAAGARYGAANLPPILAVTLPHLTADHEALFDWLGARVATRPAMPLGE